MAYIYSGEDIYRLENALKRLYEKNHIDKEHRVFIDASDKKTFHIQQVLNECDSFSLFDEDKWIIVSIRFFRIVYIYRFIKIYRFFMYISFSIN